MNYGYIRVSSDKQTVENQRFEIIRFCNEQCLVIDGWIEETVSGRKYYGKRQLGKLLRSLSAGDMIICSEMSRLGRSLFMIMEILGFCMKRKCKVWTVKDNYRLGNTIESKVLAFAFGLSAEVERDLISMRTREALMRLKSEGKRLGRPKGGHNCQEVHPLFKHDKYIRNALFKGMSQREICRRLHCERTTLKRYLDRYVTNSSAAGTENTQSVQ